MTVFHNQWNATYWKRGWNRDVQNQIKMICFNQNVYFVLDLFQCSQNWTKTETKEPVFTTLYPDKQHMCTWVFVLSGLDNKCIVDSYESFGIHPHYSGFLQWQLDKWPTKMIPHLTLKPRFSMSTSDMGCYYFNVWSVFCLCNCCMWYTRVRKDRGITKPGPVSI